SAENVAQNKAHAKASQAGGGSIGVGASVALNIGETDTHATIGEDATVSGAGDIALSATSGNALDTYAEGGSEGGTAVTPVVAISVANNDTHAIIRDGADLTAGGAVTLSAEHEGSTVTVAEGDTKSGSTGVGVSLALTIGLDSAVASIERNVTAGGAISASARTVSINESRAQASVAGGNSTDTSSGASGRSGVNGQVDDQQRFADSRATQGGASTGTTGSANRANAETSSTGSGGSTVSVAGAIGVTVVDSVAQATIADGRTVSAGGALSLSSESNTDAVAIADGSAVQPIIDFNPAAEGAVDTTAETITLADGHGLKTGDKVKYRKGDTGNTAVGGLTDNSTYYVRVNGNDVSFYSTEAQAKNTASTAGRINLSSAGSTEEGSTHMLVKQPAGSSGSGGTAVGAAVGVNVADVTNEASIGKGSTVTAQGLTVSATMAERDVAFDRAEKVSVGDDTIDLGANHLFQTGDAVRYENGSGSS